MKSQTSHSSTHPDEQERAHQHNSHDGKHGNDVDQDIHSGAHDSQSDALEDATDNDMQHNHSNQGTEDTEGHAESHDVASQDSAQDFVSSDKAMEYLRDLQRCQADFANYKKRQQESQKELSGYLIERLVMDLIPVLDNFQMATSHVPADAATSPWVTGIQYIEKQLEKVLAENGMEIIPVTVGDVFDPSMHEAIADASVLNTEKDAGIPDNSNSENDSAEKNTDSSDENVHNPQGVKQQIIAEVLQKGYKIGAKVVRPVKVSVK